MRNLCDTIFYMKANVLQDFRIYIGVSLSQTYILETFFNNFAKDATLVYFEKILILALDKASLVLLLL